jgi:HlyD family secretion protein
MLRVTTILLLAALAGCKSPAQDLPAKSASAVELTGVAALGRLEPRDPVTEIGTAAEERLGKLLVHQGQFVKAGEILAYLDSYDSRLADRERATAALSDAEARLEAENQQGLDRIREAELHLQQVDEVPKRDIEAQEARVRELQTNRDLAAAELTRYRVLLGKDAVSQQDFDRESAKLDAAKAALESEQATLQRMRTNSDVDRRLAEAQLVTRKAELETTRRSAQIASLKETQKVADADLQKTIIRAKTDGQIIEILARPGEAVNGRAILRMGDVSQMYATAEVYEADVSRVKEGQRAEISSPALSGMLTGRVEQIGTSVFKRQVRNLDPQADVDARIVRVRIRLDDSAEASRYVDLQVNIRIQTSK